MREPDADAIREPEKRPRIALFSSFGRSDLLHEMAGQFLHRPLGTVTDLESVLLGFPIDLVIVDCRTTWPDRAVIDRLVNDHLVRFILVGMPPDRTSVPSGVRTHWLGWPAETKIFFRLVQALAADGRTRRRVRVLEESLRRAGAEADLGRRTAEVLHDLGNPIDAVRRFVKLAHGRAADETQKSWLADATMGLDRMAESLTGLHRDARRMGAELRMVWLRDLVRSAAVLSGFLDESHGVHIALVRGNDCVHESVGRVLSNLLLNAKNAIGERGKIAVTSKDDGDALVIEVADDGVGFADLFSDELFKPYQGADSGGLGLGLAHSRFLVEQLGGTLDGSSAGRGRGAVFTLRLPGAAVRRASDAANETNQ